MSWFFEVLCARRSCNARWTHDECALYLRMLLCSTMCPTCFSRCGGGLFVLSWYAYRTYPTGNLCDRASFTSESFLGTEGILLLAVPCVGVDGIFWVADLFWCVLGERYLSLLFM